jgi:hypothetical protein
MAKRPTVAALTGVYNDDLLLDRSAGKCLHDCFALSSPDWSDNNDCLGCFGSARFLVLPFGPFLVPRPGPRPPVPLFPSAHMYVCMYTRWKCRLNGAKSV